MDSKTAISKYKKLLSNNDTYTMSGQMDIVSNEELYHYDVVIKQHLKIKIVNMNK